jgi:hypothetical protein
VDSIQEAMAMEGSTSIRGNERATIKALAPTGIEGDEREPRPYGSRISHGRMES